MKDYIRAEDKLHSITKLYMTQVITMQVIYFFSRFIFRRHSTRGLASNKETYFILRAYTGAVSYTHLTLPTRRTV